MAQGSAHWQATQDLEKRQSKEDAHSEGDGAGDEHLTELALAPPTPTTNQPGDRNSLEKRESRARSQRSSNAPTYGREEELTELAAGAPNQRRSDEEAPTSQNGYSNEEEKEHPLQKTQSQQARSRFATELYIHAYLIVFSILGVLSRLAIEAITAYKNAPVITPVLWANFGGSLVFGFLSEDQRLFREEWGVRNSSSSFAAIDSKNTNPDESTRTAAKRKHSTVKKTIPLFIGLATGFCGSFTSFSSFIRDAFLAMSNSLHSPNSPPSVYPPHPNRGYNVEALLAIFILEICISLSALHLGAHIAISLDKFLPSLPFKFCRRFCDPLALFLAVGFWITLIFLAIFTPPSTMDSVLHTHRAIIFSLLFGPLGCLGRFYLSKYLNARLPSFPLGTFLANVLGTLILGMCYDLQHAPFLTGTSTGHKVLSCSILEGIMEGFCGALTTVSTWVGELNGLRRRHSYFYGSMSVGVSFGILVVVMGGLKWTKGFGEEVCKI